MPESSQRLFPMKLGLEFERYFSAHTIMEAIEWIRRLECKIMADNWLIEKMFPIKDGRVSEARDKNSHHNHIATLHTEVVGRPLATFLATGLQCPQSGPEWWVEILCCLLTLRRSWKNQRQMVQDHVPLYGCKDAQSIAKNVSIPRCGHLNLKNWLV